MSGKFWVTEPDAYLEPRGPGVAGGTSDAQRTVIEVLEATVARHGELPALALKRKVGGTVISVLIQLLVVP
jgi:hypothetical protein